MKPIYRLHGTPERTGSLFLPHQGGVTKLAPDGSCDYALMQHYATFVMLKSKAQNVRIMATQWN